MIAFEKKEIRIKESFTSVYLFIAFKNSGSLFHFVWARRGKGNEPTGDRSEKPGGPELLVLRATGSGILQLASQLHGE